MFDIPFNDLKRGSSDSLEALSAVVESGWFVQGPRNEEFQDVFAKFVGVRHSLGVASGTDALELCLRIAQRRRSGHVITAANAGGYTSVAARRAGIEVEYADVDESSHCLSAEGVSKVICDNTSAVVVTHLYGRLADIDPLVELTCRNGVFLIEDCAQAVGARRNGRFAGSFGDLGAFSFYPTKNLGALGDAGAVTTNDDSIVEDLIRLRQYGWSDKYRIEFEGGMNSRLDEFQAAVLLSRLPFLNGWNTRRREILKMYEEAVKGTSFSLLPASGSDHVAHLAVGLTADRQYVQTLLNRNGIATAIHYPIPDHRQPAFRDRYQTTSLPVTELLAGRVLSLPCYPQLTDGELEYVCENLNRL